MIYSANSYFIHREKSRGFFNGRDLQIFDPEEVFLHELASAKIFRGVKNLQTRPLKISEASFSMNKVIFYYGRVHQVYLVS